MNKKADFPIFANTGVTYLDSGASAQKPKQVIDAISSFYQNNYANIHRGVYKLSQESTKLYDDARLAVQRFLNAGSEREVIFTRGTTEGINLLAYSYGRKFLEQGDEVLVSIMEHHSNFVPWQLLAEEQGAKFKVFGLDDNAQPSIEEFRSKLSDKTKIVALTHLANGLGVKVPIEEYAKEAHKVGAVVVVDGAQSVPHVKIDVQSLGADFFVFSGHKLYGPTGIGVLWGKEELLEQMPPFLSGGDMINSVAIEGTTFQDLPAKFEAGTPAIAEAVGLKAAIEYLEDIGIDNIAKHEQVLVEQLEDELAKIPEIHMLGPEKHQALVCFDIEGVHPHDISQFLDHNNIAIRAGHHCAEPLLKSLGLFSSSRASVGLYNTVEDISYFAEKLKDGIKYFIR